MFGAHISIIGNDLIKACNVITFLGGNVMQIFLHSPKRYHGNVSNLLEKSLGIKGLLRSSLKIFNHSAYVLNLARDSVDPIAVKSRNSVLEDLKNCDLLGAAGTVIHCGKSLNLTEEQGIDNMYQNISMILEQFNGYSKLIIETSTGQGSEVCSKFEQLAKLYHKFNESEKSKIAFCIDTCHISSSGYSLETEESTNAVFEEFNKLIGLHNVILIHFNDSVGPCNCKVDRHAPLLEGSIPEEGLKTVVKIAVSRNIPLVLETGGDYQQEIGLMKLWAS